MSAFDGQEVRRRYGNWRKPRTRGLGALGTIPTMFGFGGAVVVILVAYTKGLLAAIITAVGPRRDPRARGDPRQARGVRVGPHHEQGRVRVLTQPRHEPLPLGPLGFAPWGTAQLPGLAAGSKLTEWTDSYGRPFALLEMPIKHHYTVVFSTEPDGAAQVDQEQVDIWVAEWGDWLHDLGNEAGLVAASVTLETAPDTGVRLESEVLGRIDPSSSQFAQNVLRKIVAVYPSGAAKIRAYVAVTFSGSSRVGGKNRTAEEMGRELAYRLPGLTQGLAATGAGAARPVTAQELAEVVQVAYDPPLPS